MVIAVALCVVVGGCGGDPSSPPIKAAMNRPPPPPTEDHTMITAELPSAPATVIEAREPRLFSERRAAQDAWFRELHGACDATELTWLLDWWHWYFEYTDATDRADLIARYKALPVDRQNDVVLRLCAGVANPEVPVSQAWVKDGLRGTVPPLIRVAGHARLWRLDKDLTQRSYYAQDAFVDLQAFCRATTFDDCVGGILLRMVQCRESGEMLTETWPARLADEVGTMSELPAWVRATIIGRSEVKLAWRARGSGWADSVTDTGWELFGAHLEPASVALNRARALAPWQAEPASSLISVAMGQGGEQAQQNILAAFNQVRAAEVDYLPAYHSVLWAMRPRWHGSVELLAAMADGWSQDDDPESMRSLAALYALFTLAEELEGVDIWAEQAVYDIAQNAIGTYLTGEEACIDAALANSYAAVVAFLGSRYAHAHHYFAAAPEPLHASVRDYLPIPEQRARGISALLGTEHHEQALPILSGETMDGIDALLQVDDLDPHARKVLIDMQAVNAMAAQLDAGETVAAPTVPALPGWRSVRGEWTADSDGLVVEAGFEGHMLVCDAALGSDFEVSGLIDVLETSNGKWQVGVVFGDPGFDGNNWASVRFMPGRDDVRVGLARHFYGGGTSGAVPIAADKRIQFTIRVSGGQCTVMANGVQALSGPVSERVTLSDASKLGFGAYFNDNTVRVRYADIRFKRLAPAVGDLP